MLLWRSMPRLVHQRTLRLKRPPKSRSVAVSSRCAFHKDCSGPDWLPARRALLAPLMSRHNSAIPSIQPSGKPEVGRRVRLALPIHFRARLSRTRGPRCSFTALGLPQCVRPHRRCTINVANVFCFRAAVPRTVVPTTPRRSPPPSARRSTSSGGRSWRRPRGRRSCPRGWSASTPGSATAAARARPATAG